MYIWWINPLPPPKATSGAVETRFSQVKVWKSAFNLSVFFVFDLKI